MSQIEIPEIPQPQAADLKVIQGLVARNYDDMTCVSHNVLKVRDAVAAKKFILGLIPSVSTASGPLGETCVNVGFTFEGLKALKLDDACKLIDEMPDLEVFVKGAVNRAETIGDTGPNSPRTWANELRKSEDVHVLLTIHGTTPPALKQKCDAILANATGGLGFYHTYTRDAAKMKNGTVHFGYRDGISQPNIKGLPGRDEADDQPKVNAGAFILGWESQFTKHFYSYKFPEELGKNGTFAAFRIMKQDAAGFEDFLNRKAKEKGCSPELIAAQLCGRWRDGTALVISPDAQINDQTNKFDYSGPNAAACPFSAHIRRTNPRNDTVAGNSGRKHRIVRATLPYGDPWEAGKNDNDDRGLVGLFLCANLSDQFEFIMRNWVMRGGAQGSLPAAEQDPLIGFHKEEEPYGFQSFVHTRGGAYLFYPSVTGLEYIAK